VEWKTLPPTVRLDCLNLPGQVFEKCGAQLSCAYFGIGAPMGMTEDDPD